MQRNVKFYQDLQKLNDYVYHQKQFEMPKGWSCIDKYDDKKTGMYAEVFKNTNNEIVMVIRGIEITDKQDLSSSLDLYKNIIPTQVEPAYKFYNKLSNKYGQVLLSGYSLGGSIAEILGNDVGVETVTFEAYGVGDFIKPKHTENITNFGNENDPIFLKKIDKHIGNTYIIPNKNVNNNSAYYSENNYDGANIKNMNLGKHFPGKYGDISKAVPYLPTPYFKLHASYDKYDDKIFTPLNRIFTGKEKIKDMDKDTLKQFVNQYYDNDYMFSNKEELERRVRFGELIHVENYVRDDGTQVSGYYRRYPQK